MVTTRQLSFSGGEIAPSLYARVDQTKYATGLKTCRNFMVQKWGGAANRPGTEFVAEVKDSSKTVRLIPFVFNASQTYVLEFGDLYMRVHKAGAQLTESPKTITGITNANPAVVTSAAHGFTNGQEVAISGVVGMTQVNGRNFKVASAAANTFALQYMDGTAVNSTAFGVYSSGGAAARVYEIVTPYAEADLAELQYVQSADVVTLVHPGYAPRDLARTGDTSWTLSTITFAPSIAAPASPAASPVGTAQGYVVTAVASETLEESLASVVAQSNGTYPMTLTWTAVTDAQEYNVYKDLNGVFGYIGTAGGTTFVETASITPNVADKPPVARDPFDGADKYPSTATYYQQRLVFANTNEKPETFYASRTGLRRNMTVSSPIQDDDAVTATLSGRQVNEIRHLVELGVLVALTSGGEWSIAGDSAGVLRPTDINAKQQSYNGSSGLPPLLVGGNALYVQARGNVVRDIGFNFESDGYRGNDLTIFAAHLFEGHTLVDWTYQQIPHSIIWGIRDDGVLLGLTYVREHQVWAWHRHDSDGLVEKSCVVPEGSEDAVYFVVRRSVPGAVSIGGTSRRYVERLASRSVTDIVDLVMMDSALSFDGRNTNAAHTMTLTGGTNWTSDETLTLTSSTGFFSASDVGNEIHLTGSDGMVIRFEITGYTSTTVVTGRPHKTVPVLMRSVAILSWSRAVDEIGGLWHLEGKQLSITGDGFVAASPNNASYTVKTVANGSVTLDRPYAVIHAGLPVTADLETLDIDTAEGQTLADRRKLVTRVTAFLESSRGLWVGPRVPAGSDPIENLTELKIRNLETMDEPVALATGRHDINLKGDWNASGGVFLRQVDPVPIVVLALAPSGLIPLQG